MAIDIPRIALNDGRPFAQIGLGTYKLTGDDGIAAIESGIAGGYRLLDTAVNYGNEREVGEAVRRSGIDRDEIIVTTKVPGRHHGYDEAIASGRASNETLGLGRIDLLLIHWPNPRVDKYVDTFRGMIALRDEGVARSIGVSNFTEQMLTRLIDGAVEVAGADSPEAKEEKLAAFTRGEIRVLVTKPSIGAWGLNWQHSHRMTYFVSHSYDALGFQVPRQLGERKSARKLDLRRAVELCDEEGRIVNLPGRAEAAGAHQSHAHQPGEHQSAQYAEPQIAQSDPCLGLFQPGVGNAHNQDCLDALAPDDEENLFVHVRLLDHSAITRPWAPGR